MQLKRTYSWEKNPSGIRLTALLSSIFLHLLIVIGLFTYLQREDLAMNMADDQSLFGSGGGGGGEKPHNRLIEFGALEDFGESVKDTRSLEDHFNLVHIHILEEKKPPVPEIKKAKPEPKKHVTREKTVAAPLKIRWKRFGTGPGSDGGAGGGSGGGIGSSMGYSIDWGGNGGRRLLSGEYPTYPQGTDKQMKVTLQFTVMPDGAVGLIMPVQKTDASLEHAAIRALETWRFEPLSDLVPQKNQSGKVSFNFILR